MAETKTLLNATTPFCDGWGVDFGCGDDPHPRARVLVDTDPRLVELFGTTHEVHVRDINAGFRDWPDGRFDFAYSSHLLEHLTDPHAFLRMSLRILKPGGNVVIVAPHEDWYWPRGHPNANRDHLWWDLNPCKVAKWLLAWGFGLEHISEHGLPQGWSFIVVGKKPIPGKPIEDSYHLTLEWCPVRPAAHITPQDRGNHP